MPLVGAALGPSALGGKAIGLRVGQGGHVVVVLRVGGGLAKLKRFGGHHPPKWKRPGGYHPPKW